MSRQFDGVDDTIISTITAMDTGDWTIGAWVLGDSSGEGSAGQVININPAVSFRQLLRLGGDGTAWVGQQTYSVTNTTGQTNNGEFAINTWYCIMATFTEATPGIALYKGTLSTPMAAMALLVNTAGVGTRNTLGINFNVGNNFLGSGTWNGRIERVFASARLWTLGEMEEFRLGNQPVQQGTLRVYLPLTSPTASQAEDLSGNGANGTVTGATVAEGPPVAFHF